MSRMGALAIFVKTPGLSPIKTRLANTMGRQFAEGFHLKSSAAVAEIAQKAGQINKFQCFYAVAEDDALDHEYWQKIPRLWQGHGGLGKRMEKIYHELLDDFNYVILIGADIPQMTVDHLSSVSAWLETQTQDRLALAPSLDGGFWLVGGNCIIPERIWTDVTYSTSNTGKQFAEKIKTLGRFKWFDTLTDIDEQKDLTNLHDSLFNMSETLPAQQELLRYLLRVETSIP